jgi:hypothetical protein
MCVIVSTDTRFAEWLIARRWRCHAIGSPMAKSHADRAQDHADKHAADVKPRPGRVVALTVKLVSGPEQRERDDEE